MSAGGIICAFFQRHYFRKLYRKLEHLQQVKDFVFDDDASVSSHTGDNSFSAELDIEEEFRRQELSNQEKVLNLQASLA